MRGLSATHMQMFDEQGEPLSPPLPIDPTVLEHESGREFAYADGIYKIQGHLGNFVFGIQRVRKFPQHVEDVKPAEDAA